MKRLNHELEVVESYSKCRKVLHEDVGSLKSIQIVEFKELLDKHNITPSAIKIPYESIDLLFQEILTNGADFITEENIGNFLTHDFTSLMNHVSIKQYFRHNINSYCNLLATVAHKLCTVESYLLFLQNDTIFSKTLLVEKEFQKLFVIIVLPILVKILQKQDNEQLLSAISDIVNKCILNKNSTEIEAYLNVILMVEESEPEEKFDIAKALHQCLISSYQPKNQRANIVNKIFFWSFFKSFSDFTVIYKLFIISVENLGFDLSKDFNFDNSYKDKSDNKDLTKSLSVLADILECIQNNKYELSSKVKISFSQFIENIVITVLNLTSSPNDVCYRILILAIDIHPILVEKNLSNLLMYSMLMHNEKCDLYNTFLLKIFETYAKLHRIQNLISKMLPTLKSASVSSRIGFEECYPFRGNNDCQSSVEYYLDVDKALPDIVLNYFADTVMQMASWQVINLVKTFLFHLDSTVTNFMESNGGAQNNFLELVCKLFSWLLRSIRMAENIATSTILDKFINSMHELKVILGKLGETILKQEHNKTLVAAFLNLSHDWTDMYIIFHYYGNINLDDEKIFSDVSHVDYIHGFLTKKQWILLSQRITNFGESNCKHLMLKLLVQKLRAMHLFGKEINENIEKETLEYIELEWENNISYIITEKYIQEYLLNKINEDVIINIAEHVIITHDILPEEIRASKVLSNALVYVTFSKISKCLKSTSNSLFVKLFSEIDKGSFFSDTLCNGVDLTILKENYECNLWINNDDIKNSHESKLKKYLNLWKQLPIPYLSKNIQCLVLWGLFSLHKILWSSKGNELRSRLEEAIIGFLRMMKVDLMDMFEAVSLIKNVTINFEKSESLMSLISENILRNENSLENFVPGIKYLLENTNIHNNLHHTLHISNDLHKIKKSKYSPEFKKFCSDVRLSIINKHFEAVMGSEADLRLMQSYVCCVKHYLVQNDNKNLSKLQEMLESYFDVVWKCKAETIPFGTIQLFSTVLYNKQALNLPSDFPMKIWKHCKMKECSQGELQEFSQLLCLVFEHIPNENFEIVAQDLVMITEQSMNEKNFIQLSKHLRTWSYILCSSFNPVKFQIWQKVLEELLFMLYRLKSSIGFNDQILNEIINFELAIIGHHQMTLSPTMIGIFLMNPAILMQKEDGDFYAKFHTCANYIENLLKHRNALLMDRLPTYLKIFRLLLERLCKKCELEGLQKLDNLADCAHRLEKLVRHLVQFKVHIARIAPHLIADILHQYEKATLYPKVKVHLNNCIYCLISLCDHHAVSYLLRVLSSASTELFKIFYDNYKRFYRFTGKV